MDYFFGSSPAVEAKETEANPNIRVGPLRWGRLVIPLLKR